MATQPNAQRPGPPTPSKENLLINELIREYFQYNAYREALSVMVPGSCFGGSLAQGWCLRSSALYAEAGLPEESPFSRKCLADSLNVPDCSHDGFPLLYHLVQYALQAGPGTAPS
eukprot:scaffold246_cov414-Prasinococcus_capsulatus_cf.AAC.14